jgi:hypothetical protein
MWRTGRRLHTGLLSPHQAAAFLLQEQDRIHLAFDLFDEMPDRVNKPIGELPAPILLSSCKPAFVPKRCAVARRQPLNSCISRTLLYLPLLRVR